MLKTYSICVVSLLLSTAARIDADTLSYAANPARVADEIVIKLYPSTKQLGKPAALLSAHHAGGVSPKAWDRVHTLCPIRSVTPLVKEANLILSRPGVFDARSTLGTAGTTARAARGHRSSGPIRIDDLRRIYLLGLDLHEDQLLEDVLTQLNADPEIEYAELNYIGSVDQVPDDPCFEKQWAWNNSGQSYPIPGGLAQTGTAHADIDILSAWDSLGEPQTVVVAVLDSGVDYSHPDLQNSLWINEAERNGQAQIDDDGNGWIDDIYGYDVHNQDGDPLDDYGHGTHCAGILGAGVGNGIDIAGICPNVLIMAVKNMDASGSGTSFGAAEAIHYAVDNGAQVISCSWGFDDYCETLEQAIEYATGHGVVVVASAGNDDNEEIHYPAAHVPVIAVGATDANDRKASFSTYGPWIDISAPGTNILSLRARGTDSYLSKLDYTPGDNLFPFDDPDATMYIASGTSMSCPLVAGVAGLMLSHFPNSGTDYIVDRLLLSADSLDEKNPDYSGLLGTGRLNAHKALRAGFEGLIRFERDLVNGHDTLAVVLQDFDLIGLDIQPVVLSSDGGDIEDLLLAPDSEKGWVFRGTMGTATDVGAPNDGVLQVSDGAVITAVYTDRDNGSGVPAETSAYAQADAKAPVLLDVRVLTTGAAPCISIETDEPTTVRVLCGPVCNGAYPIQESDLSVAREHTVTLSGVLGGSDYVFVVELTDSAGNVTRCDKGGACYGFRTRPIGDFHVPSEYATIQEAIDNAWDGCTIWLADGTYTGPGNRDIDFAGKAIAVRSEHGPERCTIDCQSSRTERHRGFVFQHGETAQSVLQGLTVTHGWEPYPDDGFGGGAIACIYAGPTIQDCVMVANRAVDGSGLYNFYGAPILKNCRFENNEALWIPLMQGPGGGVYSEGGHLSLSDCTFAGNTGGKGGGLYLQDLLSATLTDCTFLANHADTHGGGLYLFWGNQNVVLTNCLFVENTSLGDGTALCNNWSNEIVAQGCTFERNGLATGDFYATIYNRIGAQPPMRLENCLIRSNHGTGVKTEFSGATELRNCSILGNHSDDDAGGIDCRSCVVTATGCRIAGNSSGSEGGGIDSRSSIVTLENCIMAGNRGRSGAIRGWQGAEIEIQNCSIVGNESTEEDSAIFLSSPVDYLMLVNSIVWNDRIKQIGSRYTHLEFVQVIHSNIQGGWEGLGNIDLDPLFVDISSTDPGDWDLHLSPGSPCIDAGFDNHSPSTLSLDMDNVIRPLDGDGDGTVRYDIGAFEFVPAPDGPVIATSASQLMFYTYRGGPNPPPQSLWVSNAGSGPLDWSIDREPSCHWLEFDSGSGSLQDNETDEMVVQVNSGDLEAGDHTCALSISAGDALSEPIILTMTLHITEPLHVPSEFPTIQSALDVVEPDGAVIVAPGVYTETLTFPGHDVTLQSVNPNDSNVVASTVVHANHNGPAVTFSGQETPACMLGGLTLTAGKADQGGGICGNGSEATITACVVRDNEAAYGAGIAGCDGLVSSCHIINNITNDEEDHEGRGGGLAYCDGVIEGCVIQGNVAEEGGAGLYSCNASVVDCVIANNKALEDTAGLDTCHGRIENCRIEGNVSLDARACLFWCNGDIINCLIVGNRGNNEALMACHGSIVHCTIADNTGSEAPESLRPCSGEITNCIIVGDTSNGDGDPLHWSSTPSYSCFPGAEGRGNIDVDPGFVRRGRWDTNGTVEDVNDDFWIAGDYRLTDGSDCIDSGTNLPGAAISPAYDLDLVPRPLDGLLTGSACADMGCYEFNPTLPGSPLIQVNTRTFEFSADTGADPPACQFLTIHNAGHGALDWRLEENCPWLSASPETGPSSVDPVPVALTVQSQGLAPGQYDTQLAIVSDGINNSPYQVNVGLTVRGPELGFAPQEFEFLATVGRGDPCDRILSVYNHGVGPLPWQITSDSPWLTVDTAEGSLGTEEGFRVRIGIDTEPLPFGTYTGHVILQGQTDANDLHSIPVTLYLADDEIHVPADHATIQQAIDAAQDGSVIIVADGTYTGAGNRDISYHGKAITVRSANGPEHCIIDCEQQDRGFTFTSWDPPEAVLEGVSIVNGRPHEAAGGGIYCKDAGPTIRNCVILHCESTSGAGGGIYSTGNENQVISNCIISHNTADGIYGGGGGGGIYIAATAHWITVEHCTITHNRAVRGEGAPVDYYGKGGGIYYVGSYAGNSFRGPLRNCLIAHNQADLDGGGVAVNGLSPQIINCTIAHNQVSEGVGGFHLTEDSYLSTNKYSIINSVFWGNEPNDISNRPELLIRYCDIENGWSGDNNLCLDPLFVDPNEGDFHLQSQAGRWDPQSNAWVTDPVTSPCIDAGNPGTDWTLEPQPNGQRINLGVYGGTDEASRSPL